MNCKLLLTIFFITSVPAIFAQSGRVKPAETPKPEVPRPSVVYTPTQTVISNPSPTAKETPKIQEDDIIKVESALVPIPVSVLNAGQVVDNLKIEDFVLQIDGQTAEIGEFARSETPVRLALLFDNSSSATIAREFEIKAAVRFFKRVLRPSKDLAALFSVSTGTRLEQPLTKDVSQLTTAIETFPTPQGATALLDGIIKAADYLRDADGRRVIVIVSDGEDTISDATFEETMKAVQANNCQVYVVKTKDFENYKQTGRRGGNANIRALAAERRMQDITAQTGGAVYSPIDERELDQAFGQISAELAQQYVLSYYPENDSDKRGEFRTISLSVKSRPNLTIRTRKGYYVPRQR
ncbi:MAG TPA: VWA domain-containing protein [Pyrinomonadaceae bacterium]|jgi:Ca-activated chloride channel family protein